MRGSATEIFPRRRFRQETTLLAARNPGLNSGGGSADRLIATLRDAVRDARGTLDWSDRAVKAVGI